MLFGFLRKELLIACAVIFAFATITCYSYAQTAEQRRHLLHLSESYRTVFEREKSEAARLAMLHAMPFRIDFDDGGALELMSFEKGIPLYYITTNAGGALLIKSDKVYPGGSAGLGITGAGQVLGIWDSGRVYSGHIELSGRVIQLDSPPAISDHATHVAGTMIAAGHEAAARGMSYEAHLHAWDWNNDASEMAAAAAGGLRVSQHAYSTITGWRYGSWSGNEAWHWFGDVTISETEDYRFGFYDERTQIWDEISYYAPNYIIVKSAGNDRGRGPSEPGTPHYAIINSGWTLNTEPREPNGGVDGYDCITRTGNAKNIITVGAVDQNASMTSFSSWGPTDDGRIKPDVVAKGLSVYSSIYHPNENYGYKSGTSMSSPMISGSIGLLLQHHKDLNPDNNPLSSTIKGLIIHTADNETGSAPGPNYRYGWGTMNTKKAAEVISADAINDGIHIQELTIYDATEINVPVRAKGNEPLRATIIWTDPPGMPVEPSLNPPDLMLVNDLDMRVTDLYNNAFSPYILDPENPSAAATTGDNFRDNIEMIHIHAPGVNQLYNINISHKATLTSGSQPFSLIITGNKAVTNVANPQNFVTNTINEQQIDLSWTKNEQQNDVMVVWSPQNIFGTPISGIVYDEGLSIQGGGIVLYRGSNTTFQHTGLNAVNRYYYKAFSYSQSNHYSPGLTTNEITGCGNISIFPFTEDFNASTELPYCWEIVDHEDNGQVWEFGIHSGGLTGTTGNYTYLNSDAFGPDNSQNADLITPAIDLSAYDNISVSFTHYFRQFMSLSTGGFYYSIDGGQSWIMLETWAATTENPAYYSTHLPAAGGQNNVKFKWNYQGENAWFWNVDDMLINADLINTSTPEVYTAAISNITTNSASGGGHVINDNGAPVFARGIVWSTNTNPSVENNEGYVDAGTGTGWFTAAMSGLSPNTDYYVRSFATNSEGTTYGLQTDFKTKNVSMLYIISATPINPEHGTVSGGGLYLGGHEVTLIATPNTGYSFKYWKENDLIVIDGDAPATVSYTFIVTSNRTLVAHFDINTYTIEATPDNENYGTVTGTGQYTHGQQVTLIATPGTGYHFVHWTENNEVVLQGDVPAGATYTFTAVQNRNLVAIFEEDKEEPMNVVTLNQHHFTNYDQLCFDALHGIITGGYQGEFILEDGAFIELIAGEYILLQSGTHVHHGANLIARISDDGNFCSEIAGYMEAIIEETTEKADKAITIEASYSEWDHTLFIVYPNPSVREFTIELMQHEPGSTYVAEIYCLRGRPVMRTEFTASPANAISIDSQQPGIYIIRVIYKERTESKRLIIMQ